MGDTSNPRAMEINASEEDLLLTHLQRLRSEPGDSFSTHIHLSGLRPGNRKVRFLNMAKQLFNDFIDSHDAMLFSLGNSDLVLVCRHTPVEEVDPVLEKLRALFPEDPLTQPDMGTYEDRFTSWHDLSHPDEFKSYYAEIRDQAVAVRMEKNAGKDGVQSEADLDLPLTPDNLAAINQVIRSTQIADIIRNQAVYHVTPGQTGLIMFREHFIGMSKLKTRVAPNINLFGSPWLFQYLTETLDRRMLSIMKRLNLAKFSEPISLNLNINTVMSRDFQKFHDSLGDLTSRVVVEMQVLDIFSDLSAYRHARDFLQERGYRVLVDGLSSMAINFMDPSVLQADYLKINWNPEFAGEESSEKIKAMQETISRAGKSNVILSRAESEDAVKWGAMLGISRFQGYFIDKLVTAIKTPAPTGNDTHGGASGGGANG